MHCLLKLGLAQYSVGKFLEVLDVSEYALLQNTSALMLYELEALPYDPSQRKAAKAAAATANKSDHIPAG